MSYKTLTTVVTSAEEAQATIAPVARLADALDAHLDVLALGVDRTQVGYAYIGGGSVILQAALDQAEAEARATEAAARAALEEYSADQRWAVESAVAQLGALSDLVSLKARFSDLVVLPPPYGKGKSSEAEAVVEAALFESQAPVLVLPETVREVAMPQRVVIGWNQSREAMVAVRRALPFLKGAQMVNIAIIDPPQHGPERSDPGGALCQMLVRHGVKAEVSVLARTMPRISDVLNRHVRDIDADMLVMGAYGHSRFREAILGGATRNMLEHAEVPVLMAH
ncbi:MULTISPECIES: universal stress protein [Gemmobacter]|uniref:Universal stress protein n=1 Tax=Gemmobacter nanjingensis TaxID=488454 RepID=A0ABQ3FJR1_9RHOB|nr:MULTISPECIES: universal stress protein [Gemmobacter]GHC26744.1 universal stress protein [Gemmobacter nanjingensis]